MTWPPMDQSHIGIRSLLALILLHIHHSLVLKGFRLEKNKVLHVLKEFLKVTLKSPSWTTPKRSLVLLTIIALRSVIGARPHVWTYRSVLVHVEVEFSLSLTYHKRHCYNWYIFNYNNKWSLLKKTKLSAVIKITLSQPTLLPISISLKILKSLVLTRWCAV